MLANHSPTTPVGALLVAGPGAAGPRTLSDRHTSSGAGRVTQTVGDLTWGLSTELSAAMTAHDAHAWEKYQE